MIDRERLAADNLPLVGYAVSRLQAALTQVGVDWDEAYSEALVGYARAVLSYSPRRGPFGPYAVSCMREGLNHLIRYQTRQKRCERALPLDEAQLKRVEEPGRHLDEWIYLRSLTGREATVAWLVLMGWTQDEVAARLGTTQMTVSRCVQRIRRGWLQRMGKSA